MKIVLPWFVLFVVGLPVAVVVASSSTPPPRVTYAALRERQQPEDDDTTAEFLTRILREVGLVSVTDVSPEFRSVRRDLWAAWTRCVDERSSEGGPNTDIRRYVYDDGTVRRTWATHSSPSSQEEEDDDDVAASSPACRRFQTTSRVFRRIVRDATQTIATALQRAWSRRHHRGHDDDDDTPVIALSTRSDDDRAYVGLEQLVRYGEHLEHFHAYHRPPARSEEEEEETVEDRDPRDHDRRGPQEDLTIPWHTDQGLFLVFTPGMIHDTASRGLRVRFSNGTATEVRFDAGRDDLIVLMGEAMRAVLRGDVTGGGEQHDHDDDVWVPPHALTVPHHDEAVTRRDDAPRVWYGRMVLPPADALVPNADASSSSSFQRMTYGELRQALMEESHQNQPDASSVASLLGCSSSTMQARHLETVDCDPDTQFFCWHRCFNFTDDDEYENATECATRGLDLACVNDRRQLWDEETHDPQFYPGCVDLDTAEVAPGGNETSSSSTTTMAVTSLWVGIMTLASFAF